jgi:Xaa-Pro aminopeptidase
MARRGDVFARRRRRFMASIGEGAAGIFTANPERLRSNDVEYRYRQNSDLYYLTGFPEPEAVCLLLPGHPEEEYVLFVRPRDPERETWTGRRAGVEGAIQQFGAGAAYPIEQLDEVAARHLGERERWYYTLGAHEGFDQRVVGWLRRAQAARPRSGSGPLALFNAGSVLHEMRLRKEPGEIESLRRAAAITAEAHRSVLERAWRERYEYEIEALLDSTFRSHGASGPAYPSIVASGPNSTVLHYHANTRLIRDGDLILVDAGAEYDSYCADVTRCLPAGRRFAARQRAIYEVVLHAQEAAIDAIRPGVRIEDVHKRSLGELIGGLLSLGLLSGSADEIEEKELYKPFFMHRTSHWLGLDVHDTGDYRRSGKSRALLRGMVLTVEPGLYVSEQNEEVEEAWRGIGVRIEDDVLVTDNGHEVLTAAIPKRLDDIEAMRPGAPRRRAARKTKAAHGGNPFMARTS